MNITIYPESYDWLFAPRTAAHRCVWSLGRYPPQVEVGDDLIFRGAKGSADEGRPLARALCRAIYAPGEFDCAMHDGSRVLRGWKVLWYQHDFEDFRGRRLPKIWGKPPTDLMRDQLQQIYANGGAVPVGWAPGARTMLERRGLIGTVTVAKSKSGQAITCEGLRVLLRDITPGRASELEHRDDATFDAGEVCSVCGCTEMEGCVGGCSWADGDPPTCGRCAELLQTLMIGEEVIS